MIRETYAHELEGQTIIVETVPDASGRRKPIGHFLRVRLEETGVVVANVSSIKLSPMPLVPNALITAEITLCHVNHAHDVATYETVTVREPTLSIAAFLEQEHDEERGSE